MFSGYIGGNSLDGGFWMRADASDGVYVVGDTGSDQTSFPFGDGFGSIPGFDQRVGLGIDGYLVKLQASAA